MPDLVPEGESLADWELELLAEEERWRRWNDGGDDAGDREPRSPRPRAGSGAVALAVPEEPTDGEVEDSERSGKRRIVNAPHSSGLEQRGSPLRALS
jgi:hypothetical protein